MKPVIFAIIPARGGSKGIPDKNIKHLGGVPLMAYSIAAARATSLIDRVIVSTDSEKIAGVAKRYGAEVPFLRPSTISQDFSTDLEFMSHAVQWFLTNEGKAPDYIVHLRPTTPLRQPELIERAIREFADNPEATSLRSAHECAESPFKWFAKDERVYWRPIVDTMSIKDCNLPRQKFLPVYIPNGYVDVVKPEFFMKHGDLHGTKIQQFVSPFVSEVDVIEDFHRIEYELTSYSCPAVSTLLQ